MILTGPEILKQRKKGNIIINPFDEKNINPNSYNLTLGDTLLCYSIQNFTLDIKKKSPIYKIKIPEQGKVLYPGQLYLGQTVEYTETYNLVPLLDGRSSLGRLGVFVHITAGFGDVGFCGHWTLEIIVTHPIKMYPNIKCCQIYYNLIVGEVINYNGKYQNAKKAEGSKICQEYKKKNII